MIDKNSPLPIYFQLEQGIKEKIEKGNYRAHQAIPSERELAEMFDISRMTVRQAVNNLVNAGYLYRQKGKGTFAAERKVEQQMSRLTSFSEEMKARGKKPGSLPAGFSILPADAKIAAELGIPLDSDVYEMKRIRLADEVPVALETVYISADLVKGMTEKIVETSIYEYIEQCGLIIDQATQTLEAGLADTEESRLLGMKAGSPVLLIERKTFLHDGRTLEYVQSVYRADRYKFSVTIPR